MATRHRSAARARSASTGFTLIELAVSLLILALLTGGIALTLRAQLSHRQRTETLFALDEAREALLSFAAANGRLPCPASGGAPGEGGEGATDSNGCKNARGLVPWETLGIRAIDGWNHRLAYQVTPGFGITGLMSGLQTGLSAEGNLTLKDGRAGKTLASTGAVAAALWSFGANGHFASAPDGTLISGEEASADEAHNAPTASGMLIAKPEIAQSGEEFDDQMAWISRYVLFGRMMNGGRLP